MRVLIGIGVTLLILAGLYAAYYYFVLKPDMDENKQPPPRPAPTSEPTIPPEDYYVNGDTAHDKEVFKRGVQCAKDFLYKNLSNQFVNSLYAQLPLMGREGTPQFCFQYNVNCNILVAIDRLTATQKQWLHRFVARLNADANWKRYADMAIGGKNMCSVVLENAYAAGVNAGVITGRG